MSHLRQVALQTMIFAFVLNGVAGVSLLNFIGDLSHKDADSIMPFVNSLVSFAAGSFFAALMSGLSYIGLAADVGVRTATGEPNKDKARAFDLATKAFGWISAACFILGMSLFYFGFKEFSEAAEPTPVLGF